MMLEQNIFIAYVEGRREDRALSGAGASLFETHPSSLQFADFLPGQIA
jgi:hypothetical protein